jgi:predicted dinucleotide-binding enzyme
MLGSRSPQNLGDWATLHAGIATGSVAEAAGFGELIVLAVKGSAAEQALQLAGASNLAGKTVIDATKPIADVPPVHGVIGFFTSLDQSLMERLQQAFPEARFVKAFSCVGHAFMVNPSFAAGRVGARLQAAHLKRARGAGVGKSAWNADWRLSAGSAVLFQRVSK